MLFSSRVPLTDLIAWCRALHHGLDIGLAPAKLFQKQAKSGPPRSRALAEAIALRLGKGSSLEDAVAPDRDRFPLLFVELIAVGEQAGRLPETFDDLERHFETLLSARRDFRRALIWPALSYFAAIGVVAFMLLILGLLAPAGGKAFDPLGLGLVGPTGAAIFLAAAGAFTAVLVGGFLFVKENDGLRGGLEAKSLGVPVVGACFRAFALSRFATAIEMTSEAGISADRAIALGLRATANTAYARHADAAARQTRAGTEVSEVLESLPAGLFPAEFVETVQVGELTGKLPEVMAKQARHLRDDAARKLKLLTAIAGGVVYAGVGLMIVVLIFRIALSIGGVYEDAMKGL